ncbi:MAG: DUF6636 domain-containing protein [bacterium]
MEKSLISQTGLALLSLTLFAANSSAGDTNGFRTPSKNIHCAVYDQNLRCDLLQNDAKLPPRPKDCELDWGNMFAMNLTGQAARICAGDTVAGENTPALDYGRTWEYQGFQCRSEMNGLTCTNKSNHGWFLKKAEQRLF